MVRKNNRLPRGIGSVSTRLHMSPRSQGQKRRWDNARLKKKVFEQLSGDKSNSLNDFAKNDNPLDNNIISYDVSAQVDYDSKNGGIYLKGNTFQVISYDSLNSKESIEKHTKQSFSSMTIDGNSFAPNFQESIERKTQVKIERVRGFEESKKPKLTKTQYEQLLRGEVITKNLDSSINFSKNKNGKKIGKYKAQLDLTHFR